MLHIELMNINGESMKMMNVTHVTKRGVTRVMILLVTTYKMMASMHIHNMFINFVIIIFCVN